MEHEKTCKVCGQLFKSTDPNRVCCSSSCGLSFGRSSQKKYYKCQHCGNPFWRPNAFRMKYCSKKCQDEARLLKSQQHQDSKSTTKENKFHRQCSYCGEDFTTPYPKKIYCSPECGYAGSLRLKREQWAESFVPKRIICKECGKEFYTTVGEPRKEYCCDTCAAKYHRRIEHQTDRHKEYMNSFKNKREKQIRKAFVEEVSYPLLYERDQGICKICGMPVLYDKFIDDTWGGTIDHVIPLSKGGEHSMANCQLSHRICNSLKSNDDNEGFSISWEEKSKENNYWHNKYQSYHELVQSPSVRWGAGT